MLKRRHLAIQEEFDGTYANYWATLSRSNNMLVIMNISMFFLTGLVSKGYYFTFYSLNCLLVVGVGVLVPTGWVRRLWYYWSFLGVELLGLYFLVASVAYWVKNGSG